MKMTKSKFKSILKSEVVKALKYVLTTGEGEWTLNEVAVVTYSIVERGTCNELIEGKLWKDYIKCIAAGKNYDFETAAQTLAYDTAVQYNTQKMPKVNVQRILDKYFAK